MNLIVGILSVLFSIVFHTLEALVKSVIPRSWRSKEVKGDIILITGAGSGLGRLMAVRFAKLGAIVVLWDVNKKGNDETAQMVKNASGTAHAYTCDLTRRDEVYRMAEIVKREVGTVTMLINNAGVVTGRELLKCPDEKIQLTYDVNIICHFWTVKAFLPGMMKENKGHIVTIASLAGHSGLYKLIDYCSSKFAAVGFDESLSMELWAMGYGDKIHTTAVCPYYISTGMFDGVVSKLIPILKPEDVADEIVSGVLAQEKMLIIPKFMAFGMVLKRMLPWKTSRVMSSALGDLNRIMDNFKGREHSD